jgi:hypothetical protein
VRPCPPYILPKKMVDAEFIIGRAFVRPVALLTPYLPASFFIAAFIDDAASS